MSRKVFLFSSSFSWRLKRSGYVFDNGFANMYKGIPEELSCHDKNDGEPEYFRAFIDGLPQCKGDCCSEVIVVGSGMSGLTAALMLKKAGHKVKMYEASSRVGGRVQTYRDFGEGWQGELGAMRIPKQHRFTMVAAQKYNLTLAKFHNTPHRFHYAHKPIDRLDSGGKNKNYFLEEISNVQKPMGSAAKEIEAALKQPMEDFQSLPWEGMLKKYDKYSLRSWLTEKANLSTITVDYLGIFANIEPFLEDSLVETLVAECVHLDPDFQYLPEGMDTLPRAMAKELEGQIFLNSKVTKIEQDKSRVRITFDCKGVACSSNCNPQDVADFVIVTTAAGPTISIDFVPKLTGEKIHALRTARYSSSNKVLLVFEYPFWENLNPKMGGSTLTDLPVKQIYYEQSRQKGGRGVILASYTWGRDAQRHVGMSDDDLIEECLKSLATVHNLPLDYTKKLFVHGVVKRWDLDEFTLGAFAEWMPYQFLDIDEDLRTSHGRVFFAGEHTMHPHAWIDTAMKSGARTAWELALNANAKCRAV